MVSSLKHRPVNILEPNQPVVPPNLPLMNELYEAIEESPPAVEARKLLVQHLMACGLLNAARDVVLELLSIDPNDSDAQAWLVKLPQKEAKVVLAPAKALRKYLARVIEIQDLEAARSQLSNAYKGLFSNVKSLHWEMSSPRSLLQKMPRTSSSIRSFSVLENKIGAVETSAGGHISFSRHTQSKRPCRSTLSDQIRDLQQDIQVGDLLLTAAQAAAFSGNMNLLPGCPVKTSAQVTQILGGLSSIAALQAPTNLNATQEAFLKWILSHYGGSLVSASGQMQIPSMSHAHQFLLTKAAPNLEKAFTEKKGHLSTKIVFHGTSLDRLYAILTQGLQVGSGGPLQRHGAFGGYGIYVSENPNTALAYATPNIAPTSEYRWHSSNFDNVRVMLGCEASGNGVGYSSDVHVIQDPSMLIVRYIFLMPPAATAPLSSHIVPRMASIFATLHSGKLQTV